MFYKKWLLIALLFSACQPTNQGAIVKPSPSAQISISPSILPSLLPQPTESNFKEPTVEIAAGTGEKGFQDGPADQATFNQLGGICHDPQTDDLYLMDTHKIRKLSVTGQVTTVAGQEEAGFQDGPAEQAKFNRLSDCVVNTQGNVYVADTVNRRIRLLTKEGQVQTVAGNGKTGAVDGPALESASVFPNSLALNSEDLLYFSDGFQIRRLENGMIKTLNSQQRSAAHRDTGYKDGFIQEATFGDNLYLTFDPENNLYVSDQPQRVLRKLDINKTVSTVVRKPIFLGDPSLATPLSIEYMSAKKAILIVDSKRIKLTNSDIHLAFVTKELLFSSLIYGLSVSPSQWIYVSNSNQIKRFRLD